MKFFPVLFALLVSALPFLRAAEAPFMTLIGDPADTALAAALERYPACFDAVTTPTAEPPFIFAFPDGSQPRCMVSEALRFAASSKQTVARIGDGAAFASSATAHGLCVQSFLMLAYGADAVEFDFLRNAHETADRFASVYFSELTFWRPFLQAYARHNRETRPGGLLPFHAQSTAALKPRTPPATLHAADALAPLGLPVCPGSPHLAGYLLTAANVSDMSDVELQRVLSGGVLLDGTAVAALQARGAGARIQMGARPCSAQQLVEEFTDDELNVNRVGYVWRPQALAENTFALFPSNDAVRVIGRYRDAQGQVLEAASVLIELPTGGRLAAFGFDGFSTYASEARRRQLLLAADWVAQNRLPVFVENAAQAVVIPRVSMAGDLRSVALVNTAIDTQPPTTLRLRGCPTGITHIEWLTPKEKPLSLTVRWEGQDVLVTLPAVAPWQVGWLRIEN
jgi:hypothetical protein